MKTQQLNHDNTRLVPDINQGKCDVSSEAILD